MVMKNIKYRKVTNNVCPAYSANVIEMTVTPATIIKVRRTENKDRRVMCSHRSTDMSVMISIVVEEKNYVAAASDLFYYSVHNGFCVD